MSTKLTARAPTNTTIFPTFAGLIQQIAPDQSLTQRRRQDITSALRILAKALDCRPEDIHADPALLRTRLKDQSEFSAGVSARRWTNVLSLLRFSLKHAGLTRIPGRDRQPLDSAWSSLFIQVVNRGDRCDLSRFVRYCNTRGVRPAQVDDGTFGTFRDDLSAAALVRNPGKIYRATCRAWNRAAVAVPAWPDFTVNDPVDERLYALPWSTFPASLKADIDAYLQRFTGADLLDDDPAPQLRPISIRAIAKMLHTFVSALVLKG